jgi:hypothetical protein
MAIKLNPPSPPPPPAPRHQTARYAALSDGTVARLTKLVDSGEIDMVIHGGDIRWAFIYC